MRSFFEYMSILGFAYYGYDVIARTLHENNPLAVLFGLATTIFLIEHYGRAEIARIARLFIRLGTKLRRVGRFLLQVPGITSSLLNPPKTDSLVDLRGRQIRWDRWVLAGMWVVIGTLAFALVRGSAVPDVQEVKIERLQPPAAPQPFDKRWEAPNERFGTGGPAFDNPPIAPPEASLTSRPLNPKPVRRRKERLMPNPWEFPRF